MLQIGARNMQNFPLLTEVGGLRRPVLLKRDGLLVEVHPDPATATSDGEQSLDFPEFEALMSSLRPFVEASGRTMA